MLIRAVPKALQAMQSIKFVISCRRAVYKRKWGV